jgi:hypothetical protein
MSHVSAINQQLLPLLREPLHEDAIFRLGRRFRIYKHRHRVVFLELLFLQNPQNRPRLYWILEYYAPGGSYHGLGRVPVSSHESSTVTQTNGNVIQVVYIQWNTFQQREELYASEDMRQYMNRMPPHNELRVPTLQAMGKTEEELTW